MALNRVGLLAFELHEVCQAKGYNSQEQTLHSLLCMTETVVSSRCSDDHGDGGNPRGADTQLGSNWD